MTGMTTPWIDGLTLLKCALARSASERLRAKLRSGSVHVEAKRETSLRTGIAWYILYPHERDTDTEVMP